MGESGSDNHGLIHNENNNHHLSQPSLLLGDSISKSTTRSYELPAPNRIISHSNVMFVVLLIIFDILIVWFRSINYSLAQIPDDTCCKAIHPAKRNQSLQTKHGLIDE
jgi:hypothetical protein